MLGRLIQATMMIGLTAFLFQAMSERISINWYIAWMLAASATAFAIYGLDKMLSKLEKFSAPRFGEKTLHATSIIGGFAGAWLGMFIFDHKTGAAHWYFKLYILAAALMHGFLLYNLFF